MILVFSHRGSNFTDAEGMGADGVEEERDIILLVQVWGMGNLLLWCLVHLLHRERCCLVVEDVEVEEEYLMYPDPLPSLFQPLPLLHNPQRTNEGENDHEVIPQREMIQITRGRFDGAKVQLEAGAKGEADLSILKILSRG